MFISMFSPSPVTLAKKQMHEAEIKYLKHSALAEKHQALAKMYEDRVRRINSGFEPAPAQTETQPAVATSAKLRAAK